MVLTIIKSDIIFSGMKKKPRSLQPSAGRMQKRAQEARTLPVEQQAAFYYCGGRSKAEFTSAVAAGEPAAVELALDVVAGELWLCPRDGARYARSIRAALRRACEAGLLSDTQKRMLLGIELRNLERLVLRGRHSAPGVLQQRAARRIPGQMQLMQRCFGEVPALTLDSENWPEVAAPRALLQKGAQQGWFSAASAERMAATDASLLSILVHAPDDVLPAAHWLSSRPNHPEETLCYFFGWKSFSHARWQVAPWGELGKECGLILAADGTFYCAVPEWDGYFGASR